MNFNKSIIPTPKIHGKELEKSELSLGHFPKISVVFSTILSFGVTLVTAKKTTLLLECVRVRVYTSTHIRNSCVRAQGVDECLCATSKP